MKIIYLTLATAVLLSSCLKTRAQLKDDEQDPGVVDESAAAQQTPQNSYVIEEIKAEITRLTGRIEDLERTVQKDHTDKLKNMEDRLSLLEQKPGFQGKDGTGPDAAALFQKGLNELKNGQGELAAHTFTSYLSTPNPKNEEEALFYRGQAYLDQKIFKQAILDFTKLQEKHPSSKHVSESLLKVGLAFDGLNLPDDATAFYQEVADKYPKTEAGKTAKQKLLVRKTRQKMKSMPAEKKQ